LTSLRSFGLFVEWHKRLFLSIILFLLFQSTCFDSIHVKKGLNKTLSNITWSFDTVAGETHPKIF